MKLKYIITGLSVLSSILSMYFFTWLYHNLDPIYGFATMMSGMITTLGLLIIIPVFITDETYH